MNDISKLELNKRQICIFATDADETRKKLTGLDWKKVGTLLLFPPVVLTYLFPNKHIYNKDIPFPIVNIEEARKVFRFPPLHPQDGVVYATSEFEDDLYIPLSSFHSYMFKSKHSAFIELCALLGAKECRVLSMEEDGKDITANVKANNIPINAESVDANVNFYMHNQRTQNADVFFRFPKPEKIEKYESPWMNGEPTWQTMQKNRLERGLDSCQADFNYTEDFGVTGNLAASLNKIGVNIGGEYKDFKKVRYKFEVEFWSM